MVSVAGQFEQTSYVTSCVSWMEKKEGSSFPQVASFYSFPVEQKLLGKILNFVFHWICKYILRNAGNGLRVLE